MQLQRVNYLCDGVRAGGGTTAAGVLQQYMGCTLTRRQPWTDWPKVWAHADALSSMTVHEGLVWPGLRPNATVAPVPLGTAMLVHVRNLFFERAIDGELGEVFVRDDSWLVQLQAVLATKVWNNNI